MLSENTPSNQLLLSDSNPFHGSMSFFVPACLTCTCTCPSANLPTWSVHVSSGGTQGGWWEMEWGAGLLPPAWTNRDNCRCLSAFPGSCSDCNIYFHLVKILIFKKKKKNKNLNVVKNEQRPARCTKLFGPWNQVQALDKSLGKRVFSIIYIYCIFTSNGLGIFLYLLFSML